MNYLTNQLGDVYALREGSLARPVNPDDWRWLGAKGKNRPDERRSLEELRALPGFNVDVSEGQPSFVPGPRPRRSTWMKWKNGAAPPVAIRSRAGEDGTRGYFDRLSDALGQTSAALPARPERSPFHVHDFLNGRLIEVRFTAPEPKPGGHGTVYVLDDGHGIKVGHTEGPVAKRIRELQTGNSRRIVAIAEIADASLKVEGLLHTVLGAWNTTGEWFDRTPIANAVHLAGGIEQWLLGMLPEEEWEIQVHRTGLE